MMLEAVRVRLDPSPRQARMLESHAGAARFAYNWGLAKVKEDLDAGRKPEWTYYGLRRQWNATKDSVAPWWRGNGKEAYNTGLEALGNALKNWNDSKRGRRRGHKVGFPKFKSKNRSIAKVAFTTGTMGVVDPYGIRLPRIGRVHCMENVEQRVGGGHVTRITVSKHAGCWYASLTIRRDAVPVDYRHHRKGSVGVDLGVKTWAALSDGTMIENPRNTERNAHKLAKAQQNMSRKVCGSHRWKKAKLKVQKIQGHTAARRKDVLEKATTMLARTYTDICIEDLNVQGMVRNHHLASAVEDASFAEFRRELEYKCPREGSTLHIIDRFYPSSKTCSNCGRVKAKLPLGERIYRCECGLVLDRDVNAARNIRREGMKRIVAPSALETLNARGGDIRRCDTSVATLSPVKREPSGTRKDS